MQFTQAAPLVPHERLPLVWQTLLMSQQPLGQEAAVQPHFPVDVLQPWPPGHGPQATPPAPHIGVLSLA